MNTSNIKNVTSSWSSGNDIYHAISENIITPIILVIVLVLYIASIVTLSVRIKNRRRKLKQLKNLITSRMSFEKEEKLKWEMYNENTFLVKEIYLLAISICEISYILLAKCNQFNSNTIGKDFTHYKCRRCGSDPENTKRN